MPGLSFLWPPSLLHPQPWHQVISHVSLLDFLFFFDTRCYVFIFPYVSFLSLAVVLATLLGHLDGELSLLIKE